jgi:site-specific recombinase XerD
MSKSNAENERIKRRYFAYLKEASRYSEQSVDAVAKALARFEQYTKLRDFKAFHHQQAVAFKHHLAEQRAERTGDKLSKATLHATLNHLKKFFYWLAGQPGYKSRFQYADADYFNLSDNDMRVATAKREQKAPTVEQVRHVIAMMPAVTDIERRDRALLAFTILTGARDSAIASAKLKHVDVQADCFYQDAREVRTKFAKTFTTTFFPVGDDIRAMVVEWVTYLREGLLWGNDDPLFPATAVAYGSDSRQFEAAGLDRKGWRSATAIRKIFRTAFEAAGLPYFNPHSFRHTLVLLGEQVCQSPADFKAWSQNLGHEKVLTTLYSYGEVSPRQQAEIIKRLGRPQAPTNSVTADEIVEATLRRLQAGGAGATG